MEMESSFLLLLLGVRLKVGGKKPIILSPKCRGKNYVAAVVAPVIVQEEMFWGICVKVGHPFHGLERMRRIYSLRRLEGRIGSGFEMYLRVRFQPWSGSRPRLRMCRGTWVGRSSRLFY